MHICDKTLSAKFLLWVTLEHKALKVLKGWLGVSVKVHFCYLGFLPLYPSPPTKKKINIEEQKGGLQIAFVVYFHFGQNGHFSLFLLAVKSQLSDVVVAAPDNWSGCRAEEGFRAMTSASDWFWHLTWDRAGGVSAQNSF